MYLMLMLLCVETVRKLSPRSVGSSSITINIQRTTAAEAHDSSLPDSTATSLGSTTQVTDTKSVSHCLYYDLLPFII